MKVLLAMSGGVDSSVCAHLLTQQGHDVIGIMMKLWTDPLAPKALRGNPKSCCSVEHIQRARSVCAALDIPFYVIDAEEAFRSIVIESFLKDHEGGETPNPCILCNKHIKFGILSEKAKELQCDRIATGHYVRVAEENMEDGSRRFLLLQAIDDSKDQSYFLYTLTQERLRTAIFPLGNMYKRDVYELAKKFSIPIPPTYRETQDVCFYPERSKDAFLRRYLKDIAEGDICTEDGTHVGTHRGLPFYTIGQRKGLRIGGLRIPLYVTRKDPSTNTLYVAEDGADLRTEVNAHSWSWISWSPRESQKSRFLAKVHSTAEKKPGTLHFRGLEGVFTFDEPQRGISPGQALVLYRDEEVIGGGTIGSSKILH